MALALFICAMLVLATTLVHYEYLHLLSALLPKWRRSGRVRVLVGILGVFVAHTSEIVLYGAAYYYLRDRFGLGNFGGHFADTLSTFLYFSAETYTSLGFGDIYPVGPLRVVCGFETLNGLLLIGWSASFTYVFMENFWTIGTNSK
jgi:Ion channel